MSVSHPNVLTTYRMCVVRISQGPASAAGSRHTSGPTPPNDATPNGGGHDAGNNNSNSNSNCSGLTPATSIGFSPGQLVPALDGKGLVELVSPTDVLQPG